MGTKIKQGTELSLRKQRLKVEIKEPEDWGGTV